MPNNNRKYEAGLVSVIIPTYKRSTMLMRAIDSVLYQTYNRLEIIVVNDNSPDDVYSQELHKIMNQIHDRRVLFIEQEKHINGAVARNFGIMHATGEYIAFLDDDDWWEKEKLELQVEILRELDEEWGAVSCLKKYYSKKGLYRASRPYKDGYVFERVLTFLTNITTGTILMRHTALDSTGYFDVSLKRQQDIQLFAFFSKKYKVKLCKRHLHNIDVSDEQNRPDLSTIDDIKEAYLQSVSSLIPNNRVRKNLRTCIMFSKGIMMLQNRKLKGLALVFSTIKNPKVFLEEIGYYLNGILEVIFCKMIVGKYNK